MALVALALALALALSACDDIACSPQIDTPPSAATPDAGQGDGRAPGATPDPGADSGGLVVPLPDPSAPARPGTAPFVPSSSPDSATAAAPRVAVPSRVLTTQAPGSALVIPVAGMAPSEIADTFADARSDGRVHDAADLMAPRGTPVVAAAAGTVGRLFTSVRGGLTLYVLTDVPAASPGQQTVHYYAHLDAYAEGLAAGQPVAAGQVLTTVGETGNVAPGSPHLHFAIWMSPSADRFWEGENVNPAPLLWGRATRPVR